MNGARPQASNSDCNQAHLALGPTLLGRVGIARLTLWHSKGVPLHRSGFSTHRKLEEAIHQGGGRGLTTKVVVRPSDRTTAGSAAPFPPRALQLPAQVHRREGESVSLSVASGSVCRSIPTGFDHESEMKRRRGKGEGISSSRRTEQVLILKRCLFTYPLVPSIHPSLPPPSLDIAIIPFS